MPQAPPEVAVGSVNEPAEVIVNEAPPMQPQRQEIKDPVVVASESYIPSVPNFSQDQDLSMEEDNYDDEPDVVEVVYRPAPPPPLRAFRRLPRPSSNQPQASSSSSYLRQPVRPVMHRSMLVPVVRGRREGNYVPHVYSPVITRQINTSNVVRLSDERTVEFHSTPGSRSLYVREPRPSAMTRGAVIRPLRPMTTPNGMPRLQPEVNPIRRLLPINGPRIHRPVIPATRARPVPNFRVLRPVVAAPSNSGLEDEYESGGESGPSTPR